MRAAQGESATGGVATEEEEFEDDEEYSEEEQRRDMAAIRNVSALESACLDPSVSLQSSKIVSLNALKLLALKTALGRFCGATLSGAVWPQISAIN